MIINGQELLNAAPIKDMLDTKQQNKGVSHGLSECGYDIRLKQSVVFYPKGLRGVTVNGVMTHGNFVLASAMEEFQMPANLMATVRDKSTWARQGLSVFNTVIEPGWNGFLTLELVFHGNEPLRIEAGTGIAQVIFEEIAEAAVYRGKYQNQEDKPVESRFMGNPNSEAEAVYTTGTHCSECGAPQFTSPSGVTCQNGHGGADAAEPLELPKLNKGGFPEPVLGESVESYIDKLAKANGMTKDEVVNQVMTSSSTPAVDGVLKNAMIQNDICYGNIYGDKKNRFTDGTFIHTSKVLDGPDENGIIRTRNSVYKIDLESFEPK